jgi:TPR repeat protein
MALNYLTREDRDHGEVPESRIEPRPGPEPRGAASEVFDSGEKTIVDCAHVRVERLDTDPVLFSKVFKEIEDRTGQKYDYRYWAERENFFLREFLKKQNEFTHVVQARHLISENEAAKQVLTRDAGITIANWLRVKSVYGDTAALSHPFQRPDAFLRLIRACLAALKQLHEHRIVHCDIKEDNICIPYAPHPFPGEGRKIRLEYEKLKLIDFAFSVAHAIPLTQILVINPDERVPYQSQLLISALQSDRRSGSPNAVQQLDYRVDLFSLGFMAGKISAAGLHCPPGPGDSRTLEGIRKLVHELKACESAPQSGRLPHGGLIAEIDRLLADTAENSRSPEFYVDGEWSAEEMAQGRGAGRITPSTPIALPLPTSVSPPVAHAPRLPGRLSGIRIPLLLGLALVFAAGAVFLHRKAAETGRPAPSRALIAKKEMPVVQLPPPNAVAETGERIHSLLQSDDDQVFQAGFGELARLTQSGNSAAVAMAESIAKEYGGVLAASDVRAKRSRALGRLAWMAKAGGGFAAQRVAVFEKEYDDVKKTLAHSEWWVRGQGSQPEGAARWLENGGLLAENGDRPAMLDQAFALGQGRGLQQDRVAAVETYLKVIAHADGGDEVSTRIRQAADRGLAAMLNIVVEQKDQGATLRLLPWVEAKAGSGAADMEYYAGLLRECVTRPANLDAARQWYRMAAADPAWKHTADNKARLLGRWCPGHAT